MYIKLHYHLLKMKNIWNRTSLAFILLSFKSFYLRILDCKKFMTLLGRAFVTNVEVRWTMKDYPSRLLVFFTENFSFFFSRSHYQTTPSRLNGLNKFRSGPDLTPEYHQIFPHGIFRVWIWILDLE